MQALKNGENAVEVFLLETDAVVFDDDLANLIAVADRLHFGALERKTAAGHGGRVRVNSDMRFFVRALELQGVADEILHELAHLHRIGVDDRQIADFDISKNPGLTATLYNTGGAEARARALASENARRKADGQEPVLPQENYYGWLVNSKLDELRSLF